MDDTYVHTYTWDLLRRIITNFPIVLFQKHGLNTMINVTSVRNGIAILSLHFIYSKSKSARKCRTVLRVVQKSIENGTFRGVAAEKRLNRLT